MSPFSNYLLPNLWKVISTNSFNVRKKHRWRFKALDGTYLATHTVCHHIFIPQLYASSQISSIVHEIMSVHIIPWMVLWMGKALRIAALPHRVTSWWTCGSFLMLLSSVATLHSLSLLCSFFFSELCWFNQMLMNTWNASWIHLIR